MQNGHLDFMAFEPGERGANFRSRLVDGLIVKPLPNGGKESLSRWRTLEDANGFSRDWVGDGADERLGKGKNVVVRKLERS